MPGPNTTGLPNTSDYHIGRGSLYFANIDGNGKPVAYRHLGNAPEMTITIETEKLPHTSSLSGLKVIDKEVVVSQKMTVSVSLDELNFENLKEFFSGTQNAAPTNSAIAGFTEYSMIASVKKARSYDIVNASGVRAYDVISANLTVKKSVGPVTLVLGTDYTVDEKMGRIFILSTGVVLVDGDAVLVTLVAQPAAKPLSEVQALVTTPIAGALKFIEQNPANADAQTEWQFHKIALSAEGDLSLISDDYGVLQLTGVAESNVTGGGATSPFLTIRTHADA